MYLYKNALYNLTALPNGAIALVKAGKKASPGQMSLFDADEHPRDEHGRFKKKSYEAASPGHAEQALLLVDRAIAKIENDFDDEYEEAWLWDDLKEQLPDIDFAQIEEDMGVKDLNGLRGYLAAIAGGDADLEEYDNHPQLGARVNSAFSVDPDFGSPKVKALFATKEVQDLMKWFDAESDAQIERNDGAFNEEQFDQLFEEFNEKLYQLAGEDFYLFEQLSMKIGAA